MYGLGRTVVALLVVQSFAFSLSPSKTRIAPSSIDFIASSTSSRLLDALSKHKEEDRILLFSGGPESEWAQKSMLGVGMKTRLVLRQPPGIGSKGRHSPLAGDISLCYSKVPLEGDLQRRNPESGKWESIDQLQATTLSSMLMLLKPITPEGAEWAGGLSYDLVQWTQPIQLQHPPDSGQVLGILWQVDKWIVDNPGLSVQTPEARSGGKSEPARVQGHVKDSHTNEEYEAQVRCVQESIRCGELYQLNLGRTWTGPLEQQPEDIFKRLIVENAAPFSAYLEAYDLGLALVSSSPELLLSTDETGTAVTAPIKGTISRGACEDDDKLLREKLEVDPKERAEHRMLVDLSRNDLGLVCESGTVQQTKFQVQTFPTVSHLVSSVEGRIDPEKNAIDALQALFPGGSITGCPKTVVAAAIDELEFQPRSFWTGSIGRFNLHSGSSSWNILIRTLEAHRSSPDAGWHGRVSAGSGITIGSDPASEARETLLKAYALRSVCGWLPQRQIPVTNKNISIYPLAIEESRAATSVPPAAKPRVLFVDNLDSFSMNIVDSLRILHCEVVVVDGRRTAPHAIDPLSFDAIVLGPGPGRPEISPLTMHLAKMATEIPVPVLGICLGFQALGVAHGMSLIKSPHDPVHGAPCEIIADGSGVLRAGKHVMARYNSLVLTGATQGHLRIDATDATGELPMSLADHSTNTYGVQFHPESVGSPDGQEFMGNFLRKIIKETT